MNLFGCQHDHASRPMMGYQRCFECGARRRYRGFGIKPEAWTKEVQILRAEEIQKAEQDQRKATSTAERDWLR